jgi:hypothetical protein
MRETAERFDAICMSKLFTCAGRSQPASWCIAFLQARRSLFCATEMFFQTTSSVQLSGKVAYHLNVKWDEQVDRAAELRTALFHMGPVYDCFQLPRLRHAIPSGR